MYTQYTGLKQVADEGFHGLFIKYNDYEYKYSYIKTIKKVQRQQQQQQQQQQHNNNNNNKNYNKQPYGRAMLFRREEDFQMFHYENLLCNEQ